MQKKKRKKRKKNTILNDLDLLLIGKKVIAQFIISFVIFNRNVQEYNYLIEENIKMKVLTLNLKLFLKRDNLRGERGEVWFKASSVLGLLEVLGVLVLH